MTHLDIFEKRRRSSKKREKNNYNLYITEDSLDTKEMC